MTRPDHNYGNGAPAVHDIPFPGNYPILTLQLNVTRYASTKLLRIVCSLREPSGGVEILTERFEVESTGSAHETLELMLRHFVDTAVYMQDGEKG